MAGQNNADVLQQTVDQFASRIQDVASGIAGRLGQPLSGTQLTKDEAVQRWNFTPLGSTDQADAAYHQLVAQGQPPGQALSQVYPMRQLLFQGAADINDAISTAKQVAGWAADASGQPPPEPFQGSTMPLALAQQRAAAASPTPAAPSGPVTPPPLPAPPVGPVGAMPQPLPSMPQAAPPMPGMT